MGIGSAFIISKTISVIKIIFGRTLLVIRIYRVNHINLLSGHKLSFRRRQVFYHTHQAVIYRRYDIGVHNFAVLTGVFTIFRITFGFGLFRLDISHLQTEKDAVFGHFFLSIQSFLAIIQPLYGLFYQPQIIFRYPSGQIGFHYYILLIFNRFVFICRLHRRIIVRIVAFGRIGEKQRMESIEIFFFIKAAFADAQFGIVL